MQHRVYLKQVTVSRQDVLWKLSLRVITGQLIFKDSIYDFNYSILEHERINIMEKGSNRRVKTAIYLCAILMMGAIAVAAILRYCRSLPEGRPDKSCRISDFRALSGGYTGHIGYRKADGFCPEKDIDDCRRSIFWLVGGVLPYFMDSLGLILVMRLIFGVRVGIVQSLCPALVIENFEDPAERAKVMGNMTAFQMLGAIFFSLVSGNLGRISWNIAFLVHLIAMVSLIAAVTCIPYKQPVKTSSSGEKGKFRPTAMMWVWCAAFFCLYVRCTDICQLCVLPHHGTRSG